MKTYTLTETQNRHDEVFDSAKVEPILVTQQERPSHVILSAEVYQQLLEELEDLRLGKMAEVALSESKFVGTDKFTQIIENLAHGKA
jgi:PHD/YefM family antitoxin component YafN of YafNO toxin-antitoxin module